MEFPVSGQEKKNVRRRRETGAWNWSREEDLGYDCCDTEPWTWRLDFRYLQIVLGTRVTEDKGVTTRRSQKVSIGSQIEKITVRPRRTGLTLPKITWVRQ